MGNPLRCLMVEDDEADALLILRQLKLGGFDVTSTRVDTAAAMTVALQCEEWDVVLSDYAMPHFSGLGAFAVVQQLGLDVPFIIVSGAIGEELAVDAMRLGVHDYVLKDRLKRLVPAITRELREAAIRRQQRVTESALQVSEERRNQLIDELRHALQVRDDFLSIASHELRTPVTTLLLLTHGLINRRPKADEPEVPPTLTARHVKIANQVHRMSRLINELLDVSQILEGRVRLELADVDLADVVTDVMARLEDEPGAARCTLAVNADGPVVGCWDALRVDEIVQNLLSNAIKFGRGKPIEVTISRVAGSGVLVVRDHGIGISPEDLSRIFGRFERAVSVMHFGGLGLGLWITKQLTEAMGGEITVESQPNQGSVFTVRLPLAQPDAGKATLVGSGVEGAPS